MMHDYVSIMVAVKAGVPQLIRPYANDQFDNFAWAVELGVVRELLPKQYSERNAALAFFQMLSDIKMCERCDEIAKYFKQGSSVKIAFDTIVSRPDLQCNFGKRREGRWLLRVTGQF